jgi:Bacterial protein of unknown function (DUF899)
MGWDLIPWYTITDDFDVDLGVDDWHGTNAFMRDDEEIYRTYFVSSRGDEAMGGTWSYLDITALGRQEDWEDSPGATRRPPVRVVAAPRRLRVGGPRVGEAIRRGARLARQAGGWRVRGRA